MIRCVPASSHPTVLFACEELTRHLERINAPWREDPQERVITVGAQALPGMLPPLDDPDRDDAVWIDITEMNGVIAGSNPRSVLLAVYRFLQELGFWFVKPGREGTLLRYAGKTDVRLSEKASYRHRGFCIEGAVSYENVLELIDWMPKNGFNSYFTQFLIPYEFFKTWYAHDRNPLLEGTQQVPTVEEVEAFTYGPMSRELEKRGMLFHATGHGWTTNAVGIEGLGWDEAEEPDERYTHLLAQINGKRALFKGRPLNTNLCYGSPEVQEALVDEVLRFLRKHPQVDVIHFWLADDENNTCECELCQKDLPSAFYLDILNLLDERLTQAGLPTQIVYLAYLDLLWPPHRGTLRNPDRFLFMFAPITRSYTKPLPTVASTEELPPFERNRLTMPQSVEENIAFLREWQKLAPCDSFIYEYHYMWDQFKDVSDYQNARVLWQDVRNLEELGLNGYISCQQTRVFFPCGFGMYVMGQTLWNRELDFEAMAEAYFTALFGARGQEVRRVLEETARLLRPECLRGEQSLLGGESAKAYRELRVMSLQNSRWFTRESLEQTGLQAKLWDMLSYWSLLCGAYAHYLEACALADDAEKTLRLEQLKHTLRVHELARQEDVDVYWMIKTLDRTVAPLL